MVKFAVEFWWKMFLTIFPSEWSSKISFQTSPEVRHQFRWKLRQLHSANRRCLRLRLFAFACVWLRLCAFICGLGVPSQRTWNQSRFSGRGWGQQLFTFQSPAVHWIAWTSSLNCLSCRNPYQTPNSLNCLPPFHWKPLSFTEKCFVASPSQKSALMKCAFVC